MQGGDSEVDGQLQGIALPKGEVPCLKENLGIR